MSNTGRAIVVDRPSASTLAPNIKILGGWWERTFDKWSTLGDVSPYLILLAHTQERIRLAAPLAFMVTVPDGLRDSLQLACSHINGQKVDWLLCLEKGSDAERTAREVLFSDTKTEGQA